MEASGRGTGRDLSERTREDIQVREIQAEDRASINLGSKFNPRTKSLDHPLAWPNGFNSEKKTALVGVTFDRSVSSLNHVNYGVVLFLGWS